MTCTLRRILVVLLVAVALLGIFASVAFATLESTPTPTLGTSRTNPGAGADVWWRENWGNSLYPDIEFNPPGTWDPVIDGYLLGQIYIVDRSPSTIIDPSQPSTYYRDTFPTAITSVGGTNINNTFDLLGIYLNPPAGGWTPVFPTTGAHNPLEGYWVIHYKFYSDQRYQLNQWNGVIGIDLTPPRAVTGLRIRTGLTTSDVTTWTPAARALISWDASQTDDLSGDGYFQVLIDGRPFIPETSATPVQGRVYAGSWLETPSAITVESMPAGRHAYTVVAVDRATNVSQESSPVYFMSDPDTPTLSWNTPTAKVISVNASDAAGDPTVTLSLDGSGLATLTAPPYATTLDVSKLPAGSHVLSATATDKLGRSVTATRSALSYGASALTPDASVDAAEGHIGTTLTNPSAADEIDSWWRAGWGNSLYPQFTLNTPTPGIESGLVVGMLYSVSTSETNIDLAEPSNYYRAARGSGTNLNQTVDLQGVFNYPPLGGWRPIPIPGTTSPMEGPWYLNFVWFTSTGLASDRTYHIPMGIDVTPPSAVQSLTVSPTTSSTDATAVIGSSRIHVSWAPKDPDDLSGTGYYQILIDGSTVLPDAPSNPPQGRVYAIPGANLSGATIENMAPGRHVIAVQAVDRATNVGEATSVVVYSDPDTPTISITSPAGSRIGVNPSIAATASDLGGVASVVFRLNGTVILTKTSAPYSGKVDLSAFASGDQTLTATVTDHMGRQVTTAKAVYLDKAPLAISSVSASCSKRKLTIQFNVNRAATVTASLKIPRTSRSLSSSGAAKYTFTYTYPKRSSRYPSPLSFKETYTLIATDSLGNSVSASNKITIKIAKIVKVGASGVKIVYY